MVVAVDILSVASREILTQLKPDKIIVRRRINENFKILTPSIVSLIDKPVILEQIRGQGRKTIGLRSSACAGIRFRNKIQHRDPNICICNFRVGPRQSRLAQDRIRHAGAVGGDGDVCVEGTMVDGADKPMPDLVRAARDDGGDVGRKRERCEGLC